MLRRAAISMVVRMLALAGMAVVFGQAPGSASSSPQQAVSQNAASLQPPSDAEMIARSHKVAANQHRDDEALDQYERIERISDRASGQNPRTLDDKTFRVVPTGAGSYKILLKDDNKPVDAAEYRRQMLQWASALELALKPDDPRMKTAQEKYRKRMKDRADIVDATNDAFLRKWLGGEMMNGHVCDVVQLDPNPQFHARSMLQDALTHVSVKLWVDHDSDQIVRAEAHIIRDISIGAGLFGKLYRGGVLTLEQAEAAPGVWVPVRRQYDFSGRKFVFSFEEHQLIEDSQYRHLGPPSQMLPIVKDEIASGKTVSGDP